MYFLESHRHRRRDDDDDGIANATRRAHLPTWDAWLTRLPFGPTALVTNIEVSATTGDHHAVRAAGAGVPQSRQPQEGPHGCLPPPLRADAPSRVRSEAPPGQRE